MQKFTSYEKNVIGILFGLRRTGKTVLLYQWLLDLPKAKSAYLSLCADESFADLLHDLEVLRKNGYQYLAPLMKSPFVKILLTERLFLSTDFHLLA
ncbi:MAG: hypothetical protein IJS50_00650 [Desulfovibrio sp.]|nr:hypothetical protein [Desulfovibrio sp.]